MDEDPGGFIITTNGVDEMLTDSEKKQILNAYHKNPEAMEKLIDALLLLQEIPQGQQAAQDLLHQAQNPPTPNDA